jgi:hypothetical protein
MKKARVWLDSYGVAYSFHDYKAEGIERKRLEDWCKTVGWEVLLNRAGTTFLSLRHAFPWRDCHPHHQRGQGRQPCGLRRDVEAAGHD